MSVFDLNVDATKYMREAEDMQENASQMLPSARCKGFNVVMKCYMNPQMSILNFAQPYIKIQENISSVEHKNKFTREEKVPSDYFIGYPLKSKFASFTQGQCSISFSMSKGVFGSQHEPILVLNYPKSGMVTMFGYRNRTKYQPVQDGFLPIPRIFPCDTGLSRATKIAEPHHPG